MAWSSPITAVDSSSLAASQYNASIRDNMFLMAPNLATTAGRVFNVTGPNELHETEIKYAEVNTTQSTSSASYANLSTVGPSVTATVYGQQAMVWFSCQLDQNTDNFQAAATIEVSGASSYVADNARCCITRDGMPANNPVQYMSAFLFDPLNQGEHTFTAKYRTGGGGSATFAFRRLLVWPL